MQRDAENGNQTSSRVAAAEQELQSFSYLVSHDLAASFRHVAEFSRLLLAGLNDDLSPLQTTHVGHIRRATDRCQLMLDNILGFSRIQQKGLIRTHEDALDIFRVPLMKAKAEAVDADIVVGPLGLVFADPGLLTLAFSHLLDNAIKFRHPGQSPKISVLATDDSASWRLRVTDDGIGVPARSQEKAFAMFQKLNDDAAYPGAGAGLAISRRIARMHGGDVGFLDRADGACIELWLPLAADTVPGCET